MAAFIHDMPCATSYDWIEYFYRNAPEPNLPWNGTTHLSGAERVAVIASIQQFQLGEGATGRRMLDRAQRFCRATGDLGLLAALKLFLREEQRHSRILARFLHMERAPCLRQHWIHTAFRFLRGLAGLELCLKVLVTAELLARPYYAALRDATASPLLRSISQRFFDEEGAHLRFQAFALGRFNERHCRPVQSLLRTGHLLFVAVTAGLVWIEHRPVFQAAGQTFRAFWKTTSEEFERLYRPSPEEAPDAR